MEALLIIDYTNDFVATNGALTCGEPGQQLETYITDLTVKMAAQKDFIVFACDLHEQEDPYHPESKLFPPHNIRDTDGRNLYGTVATAYEHIKEEPYVYWMDKTRYSSFAGTNLALKLRERNITSIHLVGVCTDICILHTAIDAYNEGFTVTIHEKGVASFNAAGHEWALNHFKNSLGAKVL